MRSGLVATVLVSTLILGGATSFLSPNEAANSHVDLVFESFRGSKDDLRREVTQNSREVAPTEPGPRGKSPTPEQRNDHPLANALGSDELGKKMLRLFQLTSSIDVSEEARLAHVQFLDRLKANPKFGEELLTAYDRLKNKSEFELEAAGVLSLLRKSNVSRDTVNSLAEVEMLSPKGTAVGPAHENMTEMERDVALSTGNEMVLPIVAHQVFLETAVSDREKFQGTLSAIREQRNHNIRANMLSQFASMVPSQHAAMLEALERDGIQMAMNGQ